MTKIADVAKLAGVSQGTVSRVLRNVGYVGAETRQRVEVAAKKLGYIPNAIARSLKTRKSGLIGLLIPGAADPYFFTTLSEGVERVARKEGLSILLGNTNDDASQEAFYIRTMVANAVEGIILTPSRGSHPDVEHLRSSGVHAVLVDRVLDDYNLDSATSDDVLGARLLVSHLLELGHQRIALINGDLNTSVARQREMALRSVASEFGLSTKQLTVSAGSWAIADAELRTTAMLAGSARPTAFVGANLHMTIGILAAIRAAGLVVPADLSVVSFNDLEAAAQIDPFLTSLSQPIQDLGETAMSLLFDRMTGRYTGAGRKAILAPKLIVRHSSGPPSKTGNPRK